jgi:hypothetical protein
MHEHFTVRLIDVNTGTAARCEQTVSAVGLEQLHVDAIESGLETRGRFSNHDKPSNVLRI